MFAIHCRSDWLVFEQVCTAWPAQIHSDKNKYSFNNTNELNSYTNIPKVNNWNNEILQFSWVIQVYNLMTHVQDQPQNYSMLAKSLPVIKSNKGYVTQRSLPINSEYRDNIMIPQ